MIYKYSEDESSLTGSRDLSSCPSISVQFLEYLAGFVTLLPLQFLFYLNQALLPAFW
jgi:hypothetical protein